MMPATSAIATRVAGVGETMDAREALNRSPRNPHSGEFEGPAIEHAAEMPHDMVLHVGAGGPAAKQSQRGDAPIGDPARHDQIEILEVRCDVEREPMAGDPA